MEASFFDSRVGRILAGLLGALFGWVITNAAEIIQLLTILYLLVMIVNGLVGLVRKTRGQTNDSDKEDGGGDRS